MKSESESRSVMSDSLWPHGQYSPWNSPGQNTGVGSLCLLQGIFPIQASNPGLLHCRQILYQQSHKGSPWAFILLPGVEVICCSWNIQSWLLLFSDMILLTRGAPWWEFSPGGSKEAGWDSPPSWPPTWEMSAFWWLSDWVKLLRAHLGLTTAYFNIY